MTEVKVQETLILQGCLSPRRLLATGVFLGVRVTGLEPAQVTPPEPKSGASANSAIPALKGIIS